jgi:flagellin-like hook-associated protein FlgL
MPITISSQMNASLVALTNTNTDVTMTQGRLATGLAVATASDDIAVYFKAKSYSTKAGDLDTTNKSIQQSVANLDVVDKALSNMQDTLKGSLSLLTDARAKAVPQSLLAATAGDTVYGSRPAAGAVLALKGQIVSTSSALAAGGLTPTDVNSGNVFQQGDVFAVTIRDTANTGANGTVTRYFRATSTEAAVSDTAQTINGNAFVNATAGGGVAGANNAAKADGVSQNTAYNFNDLATLSSAIQKAFGDTTIKLNMTEQGAAGSGNFTLGFGLTSSSQAISFQQTNDQGQGAGPGNPVDPGVSFNFSALFGKQQGFVVNAQGIQQFQANGQPTLAYNQVANQGLATLNGVTSNAFTYSSIGAPKATVDDVILARKGAADFFRQTLSSMKNLTTDGSLPGYNNLLKGETLTVSLNETASSNQTLKLTRSTDPLSLGFLGYNETNGVINTTATANDFGTDTDINTTIQQVNSAIAFLKQNQTLVAASKVQINARLDYNKTVVTTLNTGATDMTSANSAEEAAKLAALQNRQSFATNNMSITKQAEQSLIQLLR